MAAFNELVDEITYGLGVYTCFYSFIGHGPCRNKTHHQLDAQSILDAISDVPEEPVIRQWLCGQHQNLGVIYMLRERVQLWKIDQEYTDASGAEVLPSVENTDTATSHHPRRPSPSPIKANSDHNLLQSTRAESERVSPPTRYVSRSSRPKPSRSSLGASFKDTTRTQTTLDPGTPPRRARSTSQTSIPPTSPFSQGSSLIPNTQPGTAIFPGSPSPTLPPPPNTRVYQLPQSSSRKRPRWNSTTNPPNSQQKENPFEIPHAQSSVSEPHLPLRENTTLPTERSSHGGDSEQSQNRSSNKGRREVSTIQGPLDIQSSTVNALTRPRTTAPQLPGGFNLSDSEAEPIERPLSAAVNVTITRSDVESIETAAEMSDLPSSTIFNAIQSASDRSDDASDSEESRPTESRDDTPEVASNLTLSPFTPTKRPRGRPRKATSTEAPVTPSEKSPKQPAVPKTFSPRIIDDYIISTLGRPLPAPKPDKGFVYIMRDPLIPGLFKIGMTKGTITDRRRGLEAICRRPLDVVYLDDEGGREQLPIANYQRAEKLVHDELGHCLRPFVCPECGRKHREWFEVDKEVAKRTVRRWTEFMRKQPYDGQGLLGVMWNRRLDAMARPKSGEKLEDYEIRAKRWNSFISAGQKDFIKDYMRRAFFGTLKPRNESLAYRLVRMRWQLSCLVLSFAMFSLMVLGKQAPNIFLFGMDFFLYSSMGVLVLAGTCLLFHNLTT
ncbi:DUF1766-domain-containing protein [Mytilinidion resinicola]|uniref:DUF1766-domain-containing protein n=1 Tax=Mytilinidion resinicola TaxID=574789 RepID=A0A6A6Y9E0_9PEZI|nr:DUF1766-domain-containing protein [Mytilinidion resinicola]KAF2805431.1 DUF1766-domain-containing protein [Mytilinidion resinicola]